MSDENNAETPEEEPTEPVKEQAENSPRRPSRDVPRRLTVEPPNRNNCPANIRMDDLIPPQCRSRCYENLKELFEGSNAKVHDLKIRKTYRRSIQLTSQEFPDWLTNKGTCCCSAKETAQCDCLKSPLGGTLKGRKCSCRNRECVKTPTEELPKKIDSPQVQQAEAPQVQQAEAPKEPTSKLSSDNIKPGERKCKDRECLKSKIEPSIKKSASSQIPEKTSRSTEPTDLGISLDQIKPSPNPDGGYICKDRECLKPNAGDPEKPKEKDPDQYSRQPSFFVIPEKDKPPSKQENSTPRGFKCKDRECLKSKEPLKQSASSQIPDDAFSKATEADVSPPKVDNATPGGYKCKDRECLKSKPEESLVKPIEEEAKPSSKKSSPETSRQSSRRSSTRSIEIIGTISAEASKEQIVKASSENPIEEAPRKSSAQEASPQEFRKPSQQGSRKSSTKSTEASKEQIVKASSENPIEEEPQKSSAQEASPQESRKPSQQGSRKSSTKSLEVLGSKSAEANGASKEQIAKTSSENPIPEETRRKSSTQEASPQTSRKTSQQSSRKSSIKSLETVSPKSVEVGRASKEQISKPPCNECENRPCSKSPAECSGNPKEEEPLRKPSKTPEESEPKTSPQSSRKSSLKSLENTQPSSRKSFRTSKDSTSRKPSIKSTGEVKDPESNDIGKSIEELPKGEEVPKTVEETKEQSSRKSSRTSNDLSSRKSSIKSTGEAKDPESNDIGKSIEELPKGEEVPKTVEETKEQSSRKSSRTSKDLSSRKSSIKSTGEAKDPESNDIGKSIEELPKGEEVPKTVEETKEQSVEQIPKPSSNSTPGGYKCKDRECLKPKVEDSPGKGGEVPKTVEETKEQIVPKPSSNSTPGGYKCKDRECLKSTATQTPEESSSKPSSSPEKVVPGGYKCKDRECLKSGKPEQKEPPLSPKRSFSSKIPIKTSIEKGLNNLEKSLEQIPKPSSNLDNASTRAIKSEEEPPLKKSPSIKSSREKSVERIPQSSSAANKCCKCKTSETKEEESSKESLEQTPPPDSISLTTPTPSTPMENPIPIKSEEPPPIPPRCKCKTSESQEEGSSNKPPEPAPPSDSPPVITPTTSPSQDHSEINNLKMSMEEISKPPPATPSKCKCKPLTAVEDGVLKKTEDPSEKPGENTEEPAVPEPQRTSIEPTLTSSSTKHPEEEASMAEDLNNLGSIPKPFSKCCQCKESVDEEDSRNSLRSDSTISQPRSVGKNLAESSSHDTYVSALGKSLTCSQSCGDASTQTPLDNIVVAEAKEEVKDVVEEPLLLNLEAVPSPCCKCKNHESPTITEEEIPKEVEQEEEKPVEPELNEPLPLDVPEEPKRKGCKCKEQETQTSPTMHEEIQPEAPKLPDLETSLPEPAENIVEEMEKPLDNAMQLCCKCKAEILKSTEEEEEIPQPIKKSVTLISRSDSDHTFTRTSLSDIPEESSSHASYLSALGKSMCAPDCGDSSTQTPSSNNVSKATDTGKSAEVSCVPHCGEIATQTTSSNHDMGNTVSVMCYPDCGTTLTQTSFTSNVLEETPIGETELGVLGKSVELMCAPDCGDEVTQTPSPEEKPSADIESTCAPDCIPASCSNVSQGTSVQDREMCAPDCGDALTQTTPSHVAEELDEGKSAVCGCSETSSDFTELSALGLTCSVTCSSGNIPKEEEQLVTPPKEEPVADNALKSTASCINSCPKKCYETSTTIRNLPGNKEGSDEVSCEITVKVLVSLKPPNSKSGPSTKDDCDCTTTLPQESKKDPKQEAAECPTGEDANPEDPFLNGQVEQVLRAEQINRNFIFSKHYDFNSQQNPFLNQSESLEEETIVQSQQNPFINHPLEQSLYLCAEDIQQNPFSCKRSYMKVEEEKTCNVQQNITYSERRSSVHVEINSKNPFYNRNSELEMKDHQRNRNIQQNPFLSGFSEHCLYIASKPTVGNNLLRNSNITIVEEKGTDTQEIPLLNHEEFKANTFSATRLYINVEEEPSNLEKNASLDECVLKNVCTITEHVHPQACCNDEEDQTAHRSFPKNKDRRDVMEYPFSCSWVNRLLGRQSVIVDERPRCIEHCDYKLEQAYVGNAEQNPFLVESHPQPEIPSFLQAVPQNCQAIASSIQHNPHLCDSYRYAEDSMVKLGEKPNDSNFLNIRPFSEQYSNLGNQTKTYITSPKEPSNHNNNNFTFQALESELEAARSTSPLQLNRPVVEGIVAHLGSLIPEQFSTYEGPENEVFRIKYGGNPVPEGSKMENNVLHTFDALNEIGSIKRLCEDLEKNLKHRFR